MIPGLNGKTNICVIPNGYESFLKLKTLLWFIELEITEQSRKEKYISKRCALTAIAGVFAWVETEKSFYMSLNIETSSVCLFAV